MIRPYLGGTMLAIVLSPSLAIAQAPSQLPLAESVWRSGVGFSEVADVLVLDDGRVLVTDPLERTLQRIDPATSGVQVLGRNGDGPREYRSVFTLNRASGTGELYLFDTRGRRLLLLGEDGIPVSVSSSQGMLDGSGSVSPPFAIDGQGEVFYTREYFDSEVGKMKSEAWIHRWNTSGENSPERVTTINTDLADRTEPGINMMRYRDAIARRDDGLFARVVSNGLEVVWLRDGTEVGRSNPLPWQRVPVTEAIRRAHIDSVTNRGPRGGATMSGGGKTTSSSSENARPAFVTNFPRVVPPLPTWGRVALFDRAGRLWVNRTVRKGEAGMVDVVIEGRGHVATIQLDPRSRVVGFTQDEVLVVSLDEDDLRWVSAHPLPRLP